MLTARVAGRLQEAQIDASEAVTAQLADYLQLLAKWNRTINLTAFNLDAPTDAALDRLIVEPLTAARHIRPSDALMIDIGSGGGSPAIPIKIATPWLRVVLVESKTRKAAFLREAIRQLGLPGIQVDARRAEDLVARSDLIESADVVTVRAVRVDDGLAGTIAALLKPAGRLLWFAGRDAPSLTLIGRETVIVK
jgi:16S rRNA (guanine527-N7)-methyltransferase